MINSGDLLLFGFNIQFLKTLQQDALGVTDLGGGTLGLGPQGFGVKGGNVRGGGTIDGTLLNSGGVVLVAANQTLTVLGDYTQGLAATLSISFVAGMGWGLLEVLGTATLGGTLVLDDSGAPPAANFEDVLTANSIVNTFNLTPPNYQVEYDLAGMPNKVRVKKVQT